jgi:hypothetical protein
MSVRVPRDNLRVGDVKTQGILRYPTISSDPAPQQHGVPFTIFTLISDKKQAQVELEFC